MGFVAAGRKAVRKSDTEEDVALGYLGVTTPEGSRALTTAYPGPFGTSLSVAYIQVNTSLSLAYPDFTRPFYASLETGRMVGTSLRPRRAKTRASGVFHSLSLPHSHCFTTSRRCLSSFEAPCTGACL